MQSTTVREVEFRTGNDLVNGQDPMRLAGPSKLYNEIEMLALLTAPSVLEISVGNKTYTKNASNGLQVFSVPASYGTPIFRILRDKQVVKSIEAHWSIKRPGKRISPDYLGGSSTRAVVEMPIIDKK